MSKRRRSSRAPIDRLVVLVQPEPLNLRSIASLDSLDDITRWLGTFRARLDAARDGERKDVETLVGELEARYRQRRAELA